MNDADFAKQFNVNIVEEWRAKYVAVEELQDMLSEMAVSTAMQVSASVMSLASASPRPLVSGDEERGLASATDEEQSASMWTPLLQSAQAAQRATHGTLSQRPPADTTVQHPQGALPSAADMFLARLRQEAAMVNAFYGMKEAEFSRRWDELRAYLELQVVPDREITVEAFLELYRAWMLLRNYATLNFQAIHRLLCRFDDVCGTRKGPWYFLREHVDGHHFLQRSQSITGTLEDIEERYAALYCQGNSSRAKRQLYERKQPPARSFLNTFNLGFFSGFSIPMVVLTLMLLFTESEQGYNAASAVYPVIPVYRCTGVLILAIWLWGFVVWVFERFRINHVFVMDLDPATVLDHYQLFKTAALLSALWLTSFLLFLADARRGIQLLPVDKLWYPFALVVTLLALLLCPAPLVHLSTRIWTLRTIGQVCASPLLTVTFASNLWGDYLTSLVKVLFDLEYLACFYGTGDFLHNDFAGCKRANRRYALPALTALPLFWRLMQCCRRIYDTGDWWPHTANAGKYTIATITVMFGAFHSDWKTYGHEWTPGRVIWLIGLVISTLYAYTWDLVMDWRLFWWDRNEKRIVFRSSFHYGSPWIYVLAAILNLGGRFIWALTLITAPVQSLINNELAVFMYTAIEIVRRSLWSLFRIENEHNANASNFRAVRDIPVAFHPGTTLNKQALRKIESIVSASRSSSASSASSSSNPTHPRPRARPRNDSSQSIVHNRAIAVHID